MTEQYKKEKAQYNLKESCEDCRYFCDRTERCSMLYPTEPHRREAFVSVKEGERIYFCKMFEAQ